MYKNALRPAWVEINLNNLDFNIKNIKAKIGDREMIGVIKADAYGHGSVKAVSYTHLDVYKRQPISRILSEYTEGNVCAKFLAHGAQFFRAKSRIPYPAESCHHRGSVATSSGQTCRHRNVLFYLYIYKAASHFAGKLPGHDLGPSISKVAPISRQIRFIASKGYFYIFSLSARPGYRYIVEKGDLLHDRLYLSLIHI